MKEQISDLTLKLCEIPSITGSERDCLIFIEKFLKEFGFYIEKINVDDARYNIFCYFKKKEKYNAILCTHIDTVAPFISPKKVDETLFGRGVVDAKGILACMIFCALDQKRKGFDDIALLITVGEETFSDGAKIANECLNAKADYLIIGEPTSLKFAKSQKGMLVFDLVFKGKEAHSSMPHLGCSAIEKMIIALNRTLAFKWPQNNDFGSTLINFGKINAGSGRNIVASNAIVEGMMRLSISSFDAIKKLNECLKTECQINVLSSCDPFYYFLPKGHEGFIAGFGSDAPYLNKIAKPLLMGPGLLEFAHREDEQISIDQLEMGFLEYIKSLEELRSNKE